MPCSVKDRFAVAHEKVFMLVKQGKYRFYLDAVREPHKEVSLKRVEGGLKTNRCHKINVEKMGNRFCSPKGKNPGDVWDITTQGYSEAHFATFPEKLVTRMMLCSTRPGDRVLDPFVGSGTTGRVAIRLRRRPVMLDLGYHDQQAKRMNGVQIELGIG
jgi:site-specific DNA-methyltransferase (cytosine-N4-specific)